MAVFGNREILIDYDELPRINGIRITDIYRVAFDTRQIKDYTVRSDDASYYYSCSPYFSSDETQRVRKLPDVLQKIFDEPQMGKFHNEQTDETWERKLDKVTSIWFRTRCSGHGGFIDSSIHLRGTSGNFSETLSVTRNDKSIVDVEKTGLYDKLIKTLNIKEDIPVLAEEEYTYYPSTTLRNVDGLFYPDPVCSGWRRSWHMPYTSPDGSKNAIRVLDDDLKCHTYLVKVETDNLEVGEEYIKVQFPNDKLNYCNISKWADSKKDLAGQYIRYRIDKVGTKIVHVTVMNQIKRYAKEEYRWNPFYKIVRIKNTEDLNN